MADWRDVMRARDDADLIAAKAEDCAREAEMVSAAYALLAVKQELRALGVTIDYALREHR